MTGTPAPPEACDVAVVGAGILGLAAARELATRHPNLTIAVLDKEPDVAAHQTGHSSGVVHAGIYYTPGSLKAKLCVDGARELYDYCERKGIAHVRCGKLIIATTDAELSGLAELERRGIENGVRGLKRLDARGIENVEPHARGVAALHSPDTGIADFAAVTRALAGDLREAGGNVTTGCEVTRIEGSTLHHAHGTTRARATVICAGLQADRLATATGASEDPRIVPFRGTYLKLRPKRRDIVRGLIYPVPDPELPFLGVHLTRHVSGDVLIGPTALLVPTRRALAWPGTWRMARRFWRTGLSELRYAASKHALVYAAARFVPELEPEDVVDGFAGVRAQALDRKGGLVDDFVFSRTGSALHVRNAPSPGATSSLAIARLVADEADAAFDLDR